MARPKMELVRMQDITPKPSQPRHSGSMRSRVLESATWHSQQKSVLADVDAQIELLQGEKASIDHQLQDLTDLANAIRQGMIVLEGRGQ